MKDLPDYEIMFEEFKNLLIKLKIRRNIMKEIKELYKKEIELFLETLNIYKGNKIVNTNIELNKQNFEFIKQKMKRIHYNNYDEKILDEAINELLPYLYEVK